MQANTKNGTRFKGVVGVVAFLYVFSLSLWMGIHASEINDCTSPPKQSRDFTLYVSDGSTLESDDFCVNCFLHKAENWPIWISFKNRFGEEIDLTYLPSIPWKQVCKICGSSPPVYFGYYSFTYYGKFPFLKRQIDYGKKYLRHNAYWPERSLTSKMINETACHLFDNLYSTSRLNIEEPLHFSNLPTDCWYSFRLCRGKITPISLVSSCFRFSDYYAVAQDLGLYARGHLTKQEEGYVKDKLNDILNVLCPLFLIMYIDDFLDYPTVEIAQEIEFIKYLYKVRCDRDYVLLIALSQDAIKKCGEIFSSNMALEDLWKETALLYQSDQPKWFLANLYFLRGVFFSDNNQNIEAIEAFTEAIKLHSNYLDAFQERAKVHLRLGQNEKSEVDSKFFAFKEGQIAGWHFRQFSPVWNSK